MRTVAARGFMAGAVAVALSLTMAACGSNDSDAGQSSSGANPVKKKITVGIGIGNYAFHMSTRIAIAKGYFAEEGIEEVEINDSEEYTAGLLGGSLDIAMGDTVQWFNAAQKGNQPVWYVATYAKSSPQILAASPKSGISDLKQLEQKLAAGEVIATPGDTDGQDEVQLKNILANLKKENPNLNLDNIKIVPTGRGDIQFQAVLNGAVDIGTVFLRHRKPIREAGGAILYDALLQQPQEGFAVMQKMLDADRPTLIAFLKAQLRAMQYMSKDRQDEILQIMRDSGFKIGELEIDGYEGYTDMFSEDLSFVPSNMDDLVKDAKTAGVAQDDLDWRKYVDITPLHEAQKAVGLTPAPASL